MKSICTPEGFAQVRGRKEERKGEEDIAGV
jgi:hypothetical protein